METGSYSECPRHSERVQRRRDEWIGIQRKDDASVEEPGFHARQENSADRLKLLGSVTLQPVGEEKEM